jgi:hypothetical protein
MRYAEYGSLGKCLAYLLDSPHQEFYAAYFTKQVKNRWNANNSNPKANYYKVDARGDCIITFMWYTARWHQGSKTFKHFKFEFILHLNLDR